MASQAKAGQLLVTRAVVAATEPAGWCRRSVGTYSLKGVAEPVELFLPADDGPVAVWLQPD